jgi:hypothetical protein
MDELRKFTRYTTEGKVFLKPKDGSSRNIKTDLIDISLAGMGVYISEKIEKDTETNFVLMSRFLGSAVLGVARVKYLFDLKKDTGIYRAGIECMSVDLTKIERLIECIQAADKQDQG